MNINEMLLQYKSTKSQVLFESIYNYYLPKFKKASGFSDDLTSECMIGLIKAIDSYTPNNEYTFNTHIWTCTRNTLKKINSKNKAKKRNYIEVPYGLSPYNEVYNNE